MFNELEKKIKEAKKIAIFNHEHPDGDAFGSAYALKIALNDMGKCAEVFLREGDRSLREYKEVIKGEETALKISECDLKIALDCADIERLGALKEFFVGNTAAIDHHITHVPFSPVTVVVETAPATGEVIYDLLKDMKVPINKEIAHNLYVAIACDTGSFKYQSTTPKTHITAAELIKTGIDFAGISKRLFDTNSFKYLKAYGYATEKLELYMGGKIAILALADSDFEAAKIDEKDADGLVNLVRSVEGVCVGVYMRQRGNGFKVSMRSSDETDVAQIAKGFGGGGHIKASGFYSELPLDEIKKQVVKAIENAAKAV